jgi:hypothetical protein
MELGDYILWLPYFLHKEVEVQVFLSLAQIHEQNKGRGLGWSKG